MPEQSTAATRTVSGRLGRIRALLRLGERADDRPARHCVLAAGWWPASAAAWSSSAVARDACCSRPRVVSAPKRQPRSFPLIGIDRSAPMLAIARRRVRRLRAASGRELVRGDIRALPIAGAPPSIWSSRPYGILQSLIRDVRSGAGARRKRHGCCVPGALLGVISCPTCRRWTPYRGALRLRGRHGAATTVTLVESVRQDRRRGLTIFDEEFVETVWRANGRAPSSVTRRFSLTFRTLPIAGDPAPARPRRLRNRGRCSAATAAEPWTPAARRWVVRARKR